MTAMKPMRPWYKAIFYFILTVFMWPARFLYPITVHGRENLIQDRGFVLAPNHISAIDPLYVILARGIKKKMLIMGKEELFKITPILNIFWYIAGVFPINRGAGNRGAVEEAVAEVIDGRGLLIFPEGTRVKGGEIGRLKSGAFVVAMEAGVDMTPCYIYYTAGGPKLFRRIHVMFGRPVGLEEMGLVGEYSAKKLREAKLVFRAALQGTFEEYKDRL